jgi:acetolactate decarboxylase
MRRDLVHCMRVILLGAFLLCCGLLSDGNRAFKGQDTTETEKLFQISTLKALLSGAYDGEMPVGELKKHGDFGIGAADRLDGELIALDGQFYRFDVMEKAIPVSDLMKIPFAVVTFFEEDDSQTIMDGPFDFSAIKKCIDAMITNKDMFYAIRITGTFESLATRSMPAQKKSYAKLDEIIAKEQEIRDFKNLEGTMVGFWYPRYVGGIHVPGYHFHFITKDRKQGGHVLDCRLIVGEIQVDRKAKIHIELLEQS